MIDSQEISYPRIRSVDFRSIVDRINSRSTEKVSITKPFILLMGPSASGKSEIIKVLISKGGYEYIKPFTTRALREGETDKVPVSQQQFDQLLEQGELFAVNRLYEASYGAPIKEIARIHGSRKVPLLDYPLSGLGNLGLPAEITTINIYCLPSNVDEWYGRLASTGRNTWSRLSPGYRELWNVVNASPNTISSIDYAVINADGNSDLAASQIDDFVRSKVIWKNEG